MADGIFATRNRSRNEFLSNSMDSKPTSPKRIVLEPINRKLVKESIDVIKNWPEIRPQNQSPRIKSSDKLNKQYKKVFASLSPL